MRIGIDALPLSRQRTGIGNYVQGLVEALPRLAPQHEYFLYANKEVGLNLPEGCVHERIDRPFRRCPESLWLASRVASLARKDRVDVFWSTSPILPPGIPDGVRKICTVYDLVWLRFPETMTAKNLLVHRMFARKAVDNADQVVVISRSTGEDLVRLMDVSPGKIKLVYPGIDERYKPEDAEKAAEYISVKYGVPRRYMAAVATLEPRKNLRLLVDVLQILKSAGELTCALLIAGGSGWKNSNLHREVQAAGLTEHEIRFLGYVPDEDLRSFYSGAQVFLFPSLYEGFGIPPVEAMACGTPVVASDARPMPEVLGDAAILQSPTNANRFAEAIGKVLADKSLRSGLQRAGMRRAAGFRYEVGAEQLLQVFGAPTTVGAV